MILDKINAPNDIHDIPLDEFPCLAQEIREFLLEHVSKTGGHLASNLGTVELTLALHNVLHFPEDKLIWDVGHQAYTHKILTGRKAGFDNLRKQDGMSGFPKREESDCDVFDTGHSSTSISAAVGYVKARELKKEDYSVVAVIGDGALTGGMSYEALNNAAELKSNLIIVLNDNDMSISENVGGMSGYLGSIRTAAAYTGMKLGVTRTLTKIPKIGTSMVDTMRKTKSSIKQLFIPGMLFENMGITYLGPVNGHNMPQMMKLLHEAKRVEGPVVVHVLTEKGRGYDPAERHPSRFHGTGPFDLSTGLPLQKSNVSWTDVFSTVMRKLGDREEKVVAITAAMPTGTGLKRFQNMFPDRCFDVGIAEEHAVTFAAALALEGFIPVFAVYSSFLQRAFDQLIHDVCIQNTHVIFAVDRAGLVGADGETHQGCFDLSYLSMMPNMTVMAPKNLWELSDMMKYAVKMNSPVAIRYPRGEAYRGMKGFREEIQNGKCEIIERGEKVAILFVGSMAKTAKEVCDALTEKSYHPTLINARFVKPFDTEMIEELAENHDLLVTIEENVVTGGFGQQVASFVTEKNLDIKVSVHALPDGFIKQGKVEDLLKEVKMDAAAIEASILRKLEE